jgi:hypothetical protein
VDVPGAYQLSIHSSTGALLGSFRGNGPMAYKPEAFNKAGLYYVKFRSKAKSFTQRVMIY